MSVRRRSAKAQGTFAHVRASARACAQDREAPAGPGRAYLIRSAACIGVARYVRAVRHNYANDMFR